MDHLFDSALGNSTHSAVKIIITDRLEGFFSSAYRDLDQTSRIWPPQPLSLSLDHMMKSQARSS